MFKRLLGLGFATLMTGNAHAATLITDASTGLVTGASGVNVGGTLYDVSFVDGSCASVFAPCNWGDNSGFDFQDLSTASAAAQALMDQVITSTGPHVVGCDAASPCNVTIPWGFEIIPAQFDSDEQRILRATVANPGFHAHNGGLASVSGGWSWYSEPVDFSSNEWATWARFSPQAVSAVPEPSTWAMMLVGFGGVGFAMRRAKKADRKLAVAAA